MQLLAALKLVSECFIAISIPELRFPSLGVEWSGYNYALYLINNLWVVLKYLFDGCQNNIEKRIVFLIQLIVN